MASSYSGLKPALIGEQGIPDWKSAVLFVGTDGMLLADYSKHVLLPEDRFEGFRPPEQTIPDSVGHHQEWIDACKSGGETTCNFGYSGPLTETVLLGNVAFRTGKKLSWDHEKLEARGCPEADRFRRRNYREGWTL